MCGIAGIVQSGASSLSDLRSLTMQMTDSLQHRGPDAEGVWTEGGIALGHRRLSILDLSPAGLRVALDELGALSGRTSGERRGRLSH